jgi:hypothetical protein
VSFRSPCGAIGADRLTFHSQSRGDDQSAAAKRITGSFACGSTAPSRRCRLRSGAAIGLWNDNRCQVAKILPDGARQRAKLVNGFLPYDVTAANARLGLTSRAEAPWCEPDRPRHRPGFTGLPHQLDDRWLVAYLQLAERALCNGKTLAFQTSDLNIAGFRHVSNSLFLLH